MNEVIKSSAKHFNKYHNYLPKSRRRFRTRYLLSQSGVWWPLLCLHLCSHWLMAGHRSRSRGLTRPETRGSGPLPSISGDQRWPSPSPALTHNITSSQFRKHCYALSHMAHGLYKIIMTMTQEFMMFLWVIPLAINLINVPNFFEETIMFHHVRKSLQTLSFNSAKLNNIYLPLCFNWTHFHQTH